MSNDIIKAGIMALLRLVPNDERLAIFQEFCDSCGIEDSSCECWNDQ